MSTATPEVHLPIDTIEDAHQLRAIVTGVVGLLQHPHRTEAVSAARSAAMEAQAICDRIVTHLDVLASEQLAQQRAEQAHRAEVARAAGTVLR